RARRGRGFARSHRRRWAARFAASRFRRSTGVGHAHCGCCQTCGAHLREGNQIDRGRGTRAHPCHVRCRDGRADRSRHHERDQLDDREFVMPVNILMPALSPTMEKGNLAKWLKKEGDKVKPGDVIAEIETDKATMEYEAIDEGRRAKRVVRGATEEGRLRALIAVRGGGGGDVRAPAAGGGRGAPAANAAPRENPAGAPPPPQAPAASVSQPAEGEGMRVA